MWLLVEGQQSQAIISERLVPAGEACETESLQGSSSDIGISLVFCLVNSDSVTLKTAEDFNNPYSHSLYGKGGE